MVKCHRRYLSLSPNFHIAKAGRRSTLDIRFNVLQDYKYGRSLISKVNSSSPENNTLLSGQFGPRFWLRILADRKRNFLFVLIGFSQVSSSSSDRGSKLRDYKVTSQKSSRVASKRFVNVTKLNLIGFSFEE
ncbi:hypothetical protein AVEN_270560-1 [Araneus ventricosus]|uniref:Uncharacterized protein n=1 Tax=Araneus ventricosus TaxID=182803 RepID=A0A4Y2B7I9_ARAVE|nr:hypothetical protein AVEN_270560-1 [Araneus ventricosus]